MGMFDYIDIPCPRCDKMVEEQSKGGKCILANYTLNNAPSDVVDYIMDRVFHCHKCKTKFKIEQVTKPSYVTRQLNVNDEEY